MTTTVLASVLAYREKEPREHLPGLLRRTPLSPALPMDLQQLRFSADGAAVMCADVDLDGAQHTAAMIAEHGRPGAAIKLDAQLAKDSKAISALASRSQLLRQLGCDDM